MQTVRSRILVDHMTDSKTALEHLKMQHLSLTATLALTDAQWSLNPEAFDTDWCPSTPVKSVATMLADMCVTTRDDETLTISAVVVSEYTLNDDSFWTLIQALRRKQRELRLTELIIFTHQGDSRPSEYIEQPVRISSK